MDDFSNSFMNSLKSDPFYYNQNEARSPHVFSPFNASKRNKFKLLSQTISENASVGSRIPKETMQNHTLYGLENSIYQNHEQVRDQGANETSNSFGLMSSTDSSPNTNTPRGTKRKASSSGSIWNQFMNDDNDGIRYAFQFTFPRGSICQSSP